MCVCLCVCVYVLCKRARVRPCHKSWRRTSAAAVRCVLGHSLHYRGSHVLGRKAYLAIATGTPAPGPTGAGTAPVPTAPTATATGTAAGV